MFDFIIFRDSAMASHKMNTIRVIAIMDMIDPIDEIKFQVVYASG